MHWVQAAQLQHQEKQEEWPWQNRNEQVLQVLPQAHSPQRNQVRRILMAKEKTSTIEKAKAKAEKKNKKNEK